MATFDVRGGRRKLAAAALAGALSALTLGGVASAQNERFDITGTVYRIDGPRLVIVTSDVIGRPQAITVDVSEIKGLQPTVGTSIQLTIYSRENDTFLAREVVREYPYVNGADFGVREEFTTRQDSIQAGVGNVPEDDEALNQQHRDRNLRDRNGKEEDDDDKKRNR
jgi:hypothetical protein